MVGSEGGEVDIGGEIARMKMSDYTESMENIICIEEKGWERRDFSGRERGWRVRYRQRDFTVGGSEGGGRYRQRDFTVGGREGGEVDIGGETSQWLGVRVER